MYICKNCGIGFSEKYSKSSSGNFCSKKCGCSFSTKNDNKSETKIITCSCCNKESLVNKRSPTSVCDNCKTIKTKEKHKCKYCGALKGDCKQKEICKRHQLIPTLIKHFGFDESCIGTESYYTEFYRVKQIVFEDYYNSKLSIPEMAEKYNHSDFRNFSKILKCLGIEFRNLSIAQSNAIILGRSNPIKGNNQYKCGWDISWNGTKYYYRSSYELEYAKELDEMEIDYRVEDLRIVYYDSQKCIERIAIPDFYLPDTNEIIEIKSNYFYDEQNMKDKFDVYKKHGYKPKLILDKKEVVI